MEIINYIYYIVVKSGFLLIIDRVLQKWSYLFTRQAHNQPKYISFPASSPLRLTSPNEPEPKKNLLHNTHWAIASCVSSFLVGGDQFQSSSPASETLDLKRENGNEQLGKDPTMWPVQSWNMQPVGHLLERFDMLTCKI